MQGFHKKDSLHDSIGAMATIFAEKVINRASAAPNCKLIFHYITLKICTLHPKSKLSTLKRA